MTEAPSNISPYLTTQITHTHHGSHSKSAHTAARRTTQVTARKQCRNSMQSTGNHIVYDRDVGGQLSLLLLEEHGVIVRLTAECGFLARAQDRIQSRAELVSHLIPASAIASGNLAYWVWMGGNFPTCFDIVTPSHYRDILYDRPVHARNRLIDPKQIATTHHLRITTPMRTACDMSCLRLVRSYEHLDVVALHAELATNDEQHYLNEARILTQMRALVRTYNIPVEACLHTLHANTHWPNRLLGLQRWGQLGTAHTLATAM